MKKQVIDLLDAIEQNIEPHTDEQGNGKPMIPLEYIAGEIEELKAVLNN